MIIPDGYEGPLFLTDEDFKPQSIPEVLEFFKKEGRLPKKCCWEILKRVQQIFEKSPTLVDYKLEDGKKITIVGDIHGQYYDLANMLQTNGLPSDKTPYA